MSEITLEALRRDLVEHLPGPVFVFTESRRMLCWNAYLRREWGYADDTIAAMTPEQFFTPETRLAVDHALDTLFERGESRFEGKVTLQHGELASCALSGSVLTTDQGRIGLLTGIDRTLGGTSVDLSPIMAHAFSVAEPMLITDTHGIIQTVNRAFTQVTGYAAADIIGHTPLAFQAEHHESAFYQEMGEAIARDGVWSGEVWKRRHDGSAFPCHETITAFRDASGQVSHYITVFRDISTQKDLEARLQEQATVDGLTGAYNRAGMEAYLMGEIERSTQAKYAVTLIMMDLDHFKVVNDTHGHDVGDQVLIELVQRIGGRIRGSDLLGRWGGEEFIILLSGTDQQGGARVAEELRQDIAQVSFTSHGIPVTASMGVATHHPGEMLQSLLIRADRALYRSKDAGRNQVTLAF